MFEYQVYYWDEVDEAPKTEQGLTTAKDYSEATKKVTTYYGKSNVISICLEQWEDILPKAEILAGFKFWHKTVRHESEDESNV